MKTKIVNFLLFLVILFSAIVLISSRNNPLHLRSFAVESGSMSPSYRVGGVVFSMPQSSYQKGDAISFNFAGKVVTHRIYAIKSENGVQRYTTKGDANNVEDQSSIRRENIIGKVIFYIPFIGYFSNFLRTLPGFLTFIILPILIFIILEVLYLKNEINYEVEKRAREKVQKNEI